MKKTPQFDKIFAVLTCVVLLLCFLYCIAFPDDISAYENRPAAKVQPFSLAQYLDGSYQDGLEDALMDQMPLSETLKRFFNNTSTSVLTLLMDPVMRSQPEQYISFRGLQLFGGEYLCYSPKTLEDLQPGLDNRITELNQTIRENEDALFCLYYIECDVDNNFETGEKSGVWEYLCESMELPREQMDCLTVSDFESYSRWFYRTDHHWNHEGAYEGYRAAAQLLGIPEEELLQPLQTMTAVRPFSGTKANSAGTSLLEEAFQAYEYALPPMETMVNGQTVAYHGTPFEAYSDPNVWPGYTSYYGYDEGEVILDTDREELDNLLVLGNSYDNALLRPLAAHFNCTYAVDLRYYESDLGTAFALSAYLAEHRIDRVLLIGDNSYFSGDLFMMGGN